METLTDDEQVAIAGRVKLLEEQGPGLRRPAVGEFKAPENDPRMKDVLPPVSPSCAFYSCSIQVHRVPARRRQQFRSVDAWYRAAIPRADRLYTTYISELQKEGLI